MTQAYCTTPQWAAAGAVEVEVSSNGQQFSSGGAAFTYASAASVSSVWPVQGSAEGGTPLTVYGSGFTAASESLGYLQCRLNGTVVRAQRLAGAADAAVCVSGAAAAGYVSVEVSTNGLDFTADGVEHEFVKISLRKAAPSSGPVAGGTLVLLTGSHFFNTDLSCRFGDMDPVPAIVLSTSSLRCVAPSSFTVGQVVLQLVSYATTLFAGLTYKYDAELVVSAVPGGGGH